MYQVVVILIRAIKGHLAVITVILGCISWPSMSVSWSCAKHGDAFCTSVWPPCFVLFGFFFFSKVIHYINTKQKE